MHTASEREAVEKKLALAIAERDAWDGRSTHHHHLACKLVAALEKQLCRMLQAEQEPDSDSSS